ncbi:MAG: Sir2 silent information regulator family NAD-dependent deacetylase [Oscillospiraceae bacterium]|nr:Sir2 silent information regulator family NAD-dependent deacetylase [Oscillospiraceae bacterium]
MTFDRSVKKKMTFENFLCGSYARDYIVQDTPYAAQIKEAVRRIREADYVMLGAGAGMSAAAGAEYGGSFFEENFAEFQKIYGKGPYMQDMYSAGFYPFPDEESRWGLWSHLALIAGADLDVTPLHRTLLDALKGKKLFLLSTNADHQFDKAGLPTEQIFATQGSYNLIQCQRGCHPKTYDAVERFREMELARKDGRIPTELVPKCPVCGGPMAMNLRCDNFFVEDENWHAAEDRFSRFLSECVNGKTVLLELGVGFNTPTIIRFPFEKLTREHENITLIRLSRSKAIVPASLGERAIGINADMAESISDIAAGLRETRALS